MKKKSAPAAVIMGILIMISTFGCNNGLILSGARVYYAMSLRALGMGKFKKQKRYRTWSVDACEWLDRWTHYRSYAEIRRAFRVGWPVALQLGSIGWALGSSYSRRHARQENVLSTTAFQMLAGGVMMLLIGTAAGEWARLSFTPRTLWALAYLSTVGAIGGFVAYTYALRHLPVSFVSLYAYINPIIAVALGILILGEPFDRRMTAAAALVFAGVAIVQWKPEMKEWRN